MPVDDLEEMDQNSLERVLKWGLREGRQRLLDEHSVDRVGDRPLAQLALTAR